MALEKEKQVYAANVDEWREYEGKFVLIHGDDVIDFFDTYADALNQGYDRFKLNPFLVKRVEVDEQVQLITRLLDDAPA